MADRVIRLPLTPTAERHLRVIAGWYGMSLGRMLELAWSERKS